MAKIYYPNYNGIFSTLHDNIERPEETNAGADSILIVGTAKSGPMNRHITVDDNTVESIFGNSDGMTPAELERSAIKGFYEVRSSQTGTSNIAIMRVGNSRRGKLDLYENRVYVSGDLSYTDVNSNYTKSLIVEALQDGNQEFTLEIKGDSVGEPISARIKMPYVNSDGVDDIADVVYALDVKGQIEGAFYKPSQIAAAINSDPIFSQKVFAGVPLLTYVDDITAVQDSLLPSGIVQKTYDIDSSVKSYGDKLYSLDKVYSYKEITDTIDAGISTYTASQLPDKKADNSVPTITKAYTIKTNEIDVQNVSISQVGGNSTTLKCSVDPGWDHTIPGDSILELSMQIVRGGVTTQMVSGTDYTLNDLTGEVTFDTAVGKAVEGGFQIGDTISSSYKYKTSLTEAKNKSDLIIGNKYSYFIIGQDIIFGAATTNSIEVTFNSIVEYEVGVDVVIGNPSDTSVDGYKDGIFTFVNASHMPVIGDVIKVNFSYEPELPAYSGYVFPDSVTVQLSALSGGSDGTSMSLYDYKQVIENAFSESENYPARFIVIQGAYFDDTVSGYNAETGLPENQNIDWHTLLKNVTDRKSNFVSECEAIITHKPLINPESPSAYNNWLKTMTEVSITNPLRAANIAKTMTDFRLSIPVGEVNGSGLPGKGVYPLYTPNVLVAMKSELPIGETLTHNQLPGNIIGMRYIIKSSKDIDALNGMRYTTLGIEVENVLDQTLSTVKIMDAPTMATPGSQFDRQSTYRSIVEGLKVIRKTLKPFIGKILDDALLLTINHRLNIALQVLVPDVLKAYLIDVKATRNQMLAGTTAITFHGITGSELRRFSVDTTASKVA